MSDLENKKHPIGIEKHFCDIESNIFSYYESFYEVLPIMNLDNYELLWQFNKAKIVLDNEIDNHIEIIDSPVEHGKKHCPKMDDEEFQNLLKQEEINIKTYKQYPEIYEVYMKTTQTKIDNTEKMLPSLSISLNDYKNWKNYLVAKRFYNHSIKDQEDSFSNNLVIASFISELYKVVMDEPASKKRQLGTNQINKLIFSNPALEIFSLDNLSLKDKALVLALTGNDLKGYFRSKTTDSLETKEQKKDQQIMFEIKKHDLAKKVINIIFDDLFSQNKTNALYENDWIVAGQYLNATSSFMRHYNYEDSYNGEIMSYDQLIANKMKTLDEVVLKDDEKETTELADKKDRRR